MKYKVEKNVLVSKGNAKLGKIKNFSLPSGVSCPGKSEWCKNCYASKYENRYKNCLTAYNRNFDWSKKSYFPDLVIGQLKCLTGNNVRVHPSGDFYSQEYIEHWITICKQLKGHNFWCYTRSWVIPKLFIKLKELNKLRNSQVILSTDPTMDFPPEKEKFRIAFVEEDERKSGIICLHDSGAKHSCDECGYCFLKDNGNVIFKNKLKRRKK